MTYIRTFLPLENPCLTLSPMVVLELDSDNACALEVEIYRLRLSSLIDNSLKKYCIKYQSSKLNVLSQP